MAGPMFTGSITAMVTPFAGGTVDEASFRKFVDWQIDEGTEALVPVGTTGESPTLTHDEHKQVVEICVDQVRGRVPVIAGTGSNSTAEAVDFTRHAQAVGADAALVVTPYYNKPNQEGLYQHFKAIHDASALPILIYNIPGRSVIDMSVETMARLAELPRVVGVKDATADVLRPWKTRQALPADFAMLSGEDATVLPFLAMGGHGCISVASNVAPRLCRELHDAWRAGRTAEAQALNDRLMPLFGALFVEPNPQPVKYALSLLGHCREEVRLPLVPVAPETQAKVHGAMVHAGLIN